MFPADSEDESPRASGLGGPLMGKRPRLGDGVGAPKRSAMPHPQGWSTELALPWEWEACSPDWSLDRGLVFKAVLLQTGMLDFPNIVVGLTKFSCSSFGSWVLASAVFLSLLRARYGRRTPPSSRQQRLWSSIWTRSNLSRPQPCRGPCHPDRTYYFSVY